MDAKDPVDAEDVGDAEDVEEAGVLRILGMPKILGMLEMLGILRTLRMLGKLGMLGIQFRSCFCCKSASSPIPLLLLKVLVSSYMIVCYKYFILWPPYCIFSVSGIEPRSS